MAQAEKSDFGKKGKEFLEEIGKTAGNVGEAVSKGGENIGKSKAFKTVTEVCGGESWGRGAF